MNRFDVLFQSVLAILALAIMNRSVYHDSVGRSIGCAVAVVACFWMGRCGMLLFRKLRRSGRMTNE